MRRRLITGMCLSVMGALMLSATVLAGKHATHGGQQTYLIRQPQSRRSRLTFDLSGDWKQARDLHHRLYPLCRAAFFETNPIPIKEAMAMAGISRIGQIGLLQPVFVALFAAAFADVPTPRTMIFCNFDGEEQGLRDIRFVGRPDELYGEEPVAYVVPRPGRALDQHPERLRQGVRLARRRRHAARRRRSRRRRRHQLRRRTVDRGGRPAAGAGQGRLRRHRLQRSACGALARSQLRLAAVTVRWRPVCALAGCDWSADEPGGAVIDIERC